MDAKKKDGVEDDKSLPEIKIISNNEEIIKTTGEHFANKLGRQIHMLILDEPMYTQQIANTLDVDVALVIYHLKKMTELNIVKITIKQIKGRRGEKHKFFQSIPVVTVIMRKTDDEIKDKKFLNRIFKKGIKFTMIIFTAFLSWSTINFLTKPQTFIIQSDLTNKSFIEIIYSSEITSLVISNIIAILLTLIIMKKRKKRILPL